MASGAGLEHNKQLVHRIVEEMFNKGKLDVAPEIFAPDFVDRGHESMAEKAGGPDGFANFVKAVRAALPDIKATYSGNSRGRRSRRHVEYRDRDASRRAV